MKAQNYFPEKEVISSKLKITCLHLHVHEKKEIPIREKFTSVFEILIYLKMPEGKEGWGAWGEEGKKNEREAEKVGAENLQREEQFDRLSPCLSNFKRHSLIFFFS